MTVSIIIPTYNRADTLEITLSSIYQQLNLEGVEVIVIDNGSTDNTANSCERLAKEYSPALKYQFNAEPGLLTGRHAGASLATGEILCFIDDDVELSRTWITGVKDAFRDDEIQLATGPCLPKYESPPPSWLNFFGKVWAAKADYAPG